MASERAMQEADLMGYATPEWAEMREPNRFQFTAEAHSLRSAIEERGGKIVWGEG